ncbi:hypothetical protein Tco_0378075 [Tanacetum coccineum]
MVHNYYLEEAKKKRQIQKEQALNSKPSVLKSARLPNTANGSKPKPRNSYQQPRNCPPSMSSRVSNKVVNIAEPPRNSKPFLNSKNLAWIPTGRTVGTCLNINDSVIPLGTETCTPNTVICANSSSLSADVPVSRTSKYGESNASALEDLMLKAGKPINEVLIMNLPDHRYNIYTVNFPHRIGVTDDGVTTSSSTDSLPHAHA